MLYTNFTTIKDFVIIGFAGLNPLYNGPVGALFFLTYLAILAGNTFILVFVGSERRLHKPTYLIFCHLAANDLLFGTVTLPKAISRYWLDDRGMSFAACFTQMYFVHSLGAIHSLLLLIMALDRFIAVCLPLKYPVLMTNRSTSAACGLSWIVTFLRMVGVVFHALSLPYCDSNIISRCYCDHTSITALGCGSGVRDVQTVAFILAMFSLLVPLSFILFSYSAIFLVVFRMQNAEGRYKIVSTCVPQLLISSLYYCPRCFVYLANLVKFSFSLDFHIALIMLYSLFPCVVNPAIYCLKTKDIKDVLRKRIKEVKSRIREGLK